MFSGNSRATPFSRPEWLLPMAAEKLRSDWLLDLKTGIAPLYLTRKGITRTVRLCGADYEDVVATPGKEQETVAALLRRLQERRREWDVCDFRFLLPQSVLSSTLVANPGPETIGARGKFQVVEWPFRLFYQTMLPETWQEYEPHIGKKLAYQMRSAEGKRNREFDSAELRMADSGTLEEDVEALIALHTTRWQARGETGIFATAESRAAMRQVCENFLALGQLRLYTLWLNHQPASALFAIADGQRIHYYISGFNPEFGKYHPTKVLLAQAMKDGIRIGPTEFDFMKGTEEYKTDWANHERTTTQIVIANSTPRGRLSLLFINILRKHKLKRARVKKEDSAQ
jgi:hypothetical protein